MAAKYKKGAVRRYPKPNKIEVMFRVSALLMDRGEPFQYVILGRQGKVKVVK